MNQLVRWSRPQVIRLDTTTFHLDYRSGERNEFLINIKILSHLLSICQSLNDRFNNPWTKTSFIGRAITLLWNENHLQSFHVTWHVNFRSGTLEQVLEDFMWDYGLWQCQGRYLESGMRRTLLGRPETKTRASYLSFTSQWALVGQFRKRFGRQEILTVVQWLVRILIPRSQDSSCGKTELLFTSSSCEESSRWAIMILGYWWINSILVSKSKLFRLFNQLGLSGWPSGVRLTTSSSMAEVGEVTEPLKATEKRDA